MDLSSSKRKPSSIQKKRSVIKLGEHKRSLSASKSQLSSSPLIESTVNRGIVNAIDNRLEWTYSRICNNQMQNFSSEETRFPNDLLSDYISYVYKNYNIKDPKSKPTHGGIQSNIESYSRIYNSNVVTPIKDRQYEYNTGTNRSQAPYQSSRNKSIKEVLSYGRSSNINSNQKSVERSYAINDYNNNNNINHSINSNVNYNSVTKNNSIRNSSHYNHSPFDSIKHGEGLNEYYNSQLSSRQEQQKRGKVLARDPPILHTKIPIGSYNN